MGLNFLNKYKFSDALSTQQLVRRLNDGRTLIYFASGNAVKEDYFKLDYENIVLVDQEFRINVVIQEKIFCLSMDSMKAVHLFHKEKIKVDCVVAMNEGLYEGGGNYPLNSDIFWGYCSPILNNKYIHIAYPPEYYYEKPKIKHGYPTTSEYAHLATFYLDVPFTEKIKLEPGADGYIDPAIFSMWHPHMTEKSSVYYFNERSATSHSFQINNTRVTVSHKSIWDEAEESDSLFVILFNYTQKKILLDLHPNLNNSYGLKPNQIYDFINDNKFRSVAFAPIRGGFNDLFELLKQSPISTLDEIKIYHLLNHDLSALYSL